MGKFTVQGRDALAVLNRVSANQIDVPVGQNVYTQWLNDQGGILSDLTITRTGETEFLLVTGDILQSFTPAWLRRHTRPDEVCTVTDVTSAYTILSLQGPRSRDILAAVTGADLSTAALPFRSSTAFGDRPGSGACRADHLHGGTGLRALRPHRIRPRRP